MGVKPMINSGICIPLGRNSRAVAILLWCLLAGGCAKTVKSLGELSRLQTAIVREFGEQDVGVNLNNDTFLSITFVNSPLNDKSPAERAKRAQQAAAFVAEHYDSIAKINEIWVAFVRSQTRFIFVHYSKTIVVLGFDKEGRPLTRSPPESPPTSVPDYSLRPTAVYSPDSKQTDVMITGVQLPGDLNQGLTMSVYFKAPGDATGVRRATAPELVSFDFASHSEKSLFPGAPKIQFLADGKVVFQTTAQFSTSKNADGLFSEFVTIPLPYPAFRRLAAGKKSMLKLGDYEYNLTEEHLKALRRMTEYVSD